MSGPEGLERTGQHAPQPWCLRRSCSHLSWSHNVTWSHCVGGLAGRGQLPSDGWMAALLAGPCLGDGPAAHSPAVSMHRGWAGGLLT